MRHEKNSNLFLRVIYISGMIFIVILCVWMIFSKINRDSNEKHTTIQENKTNTDETIDGFYDLKEFLTYFENALETDDVDKYLRGCAIEEKVENYPFTNYMDQSNYFSYDAAFLPSKSYSEYGQINQLLITRDFLEQYEALRNQLIELSGKKKIKIKFEKVGILYNDNQLESNFIKNIKARSDRWDADYFIELTALIKVSGKNYTFCFTIGRYDQAYKLFKLQAKLSEWKSKVYVKKITQKEFKKMYSSTDINDYSSKLEEKVMEEIPEKIADSKLEVDSAEAVLPINYLIIGQEYCNSAHECISKFLLEITRHNSLKALNYCLGYKDDDGLNEIVDQEGYMAQQLSYVYKGLSGLPYSTILGIKYSYLDFFCSDIAHMMNPKGLHTMSILSIDDTDYSNEYTALIYYNKEYYRLGFTLTRTEKGWIIASLSARRSDIDIGEVINTEEE